MKPDARLTIDCEECGYSYEASGEYSEGRYWPNEDTISRHELGHTTCMRCLATIHEDREDDHLKLDCEPEEYRGYELTRAYPSGTQADSIRFVSKEYTGDCDNRCGFARTYYLAMQQIDELEDENG